MTQPLRILHLLDSLRPGGTENGVVNVAQRLTGSVDTHVACLRASGDFAARLPVPSQVYVLGKGNGFTPRTVLALRQTLQRLQPNVVHTHNLGPLIYAALATAAGITTPILHGEHGQIQEQERNARRRWQRRLLFRCCQGVHTVSQSMISALASEGLPVRGMTAITNGVDACMFRPAESKAAARGALGLPEHGLVMGIVGRFVALKRHLLLLRAFDQVAADVPGLRLVILGDGGSDQDNVRAAIESHPRRAQIHWPGMQTNTVPWYQTLDLLVAPSLIEGLSNAVLEAMSCGVPVLAHAACGNSEVIVHEANGYCDSIQTVEDLAASLRQRLARPDSLHSAGIEARQHVLVNFSLDSMAQGYLRVYQRCAARQHRYCP
jgi:glycosyltransferase involved in cell wall biosynthesis